ncbi:MAG: hypothetical protein HKN87_17005 [Saprospiraceae bacterium]|nr:hypothetical protein [Saprospiraceae bacterium]
MKEGFSIFFAIYFLLGGLFPNADFGQLAHIPEAIAHFQEHQREAQLKRVDFSILSFIQDHYSDPDGHEHDDQTSHDQLPLQHVHQTVQLVHLQVQVAFVDWLYPAVSEEIIFYRVLTSEDFRVGIDHPPAS